MKKRTVITTETLEVWVVRQTSQAAEGPAPEDRGIEYPSKSLTVERDHDAKKNNDSAAESTATAGQE